MIQALYQALQISVSWERVSEIQSIKGAVLATFDLLHTSLVERQDALAWHGQQV